MEPIYLDNNATTAVAPEVVGAMLPFLTEWFGNPSSAHNQGEIVACAIRSARRSVRDLIGASSDQEVIFTSGGTESDNTAILSGLHGNGDRDELVISTVEHPAIMTLCADLEKRHGTRIHRIPVDRHGRLDIGAYRAALGPRTALVSIMWANNETGTLFPVSEFAALAHAAGALFHTDAVQAVGKFPFNVHDAGIDMLSLSAHKLHGPKGIGALYVRKGVPFTALIHGGRQERGRRGGTENVPGIVGLGKAAELALSRMDSDLPRIGALRDRLERGILSRIPNCWIIGDTQNRVANTTTLAFDRADADPMLAQLGKAGIAVSSGSACSSGSLEPSHVLRAMGVPFTAIRGAIRFSLSRRNLESEIDHILALLPSVVERARAMSMFADNADDASAELHAHAS